MNLLVQIALSLIVTSPPQDAVAAGDCPLLFVPSDTSGISQGAAPDWMLVWPESAGEAIELLENFVVRIESPHAEADYWQTRHARRSLRGVRTMRRNSPRGLDNADWRTVEVDPREPVQGLVDPGYFRLVMRYIAVGDGGKRVVNVCTAISPAFSSEDTVVRTTLE